MLKRLGDWFKGSQASSTQPLRTPETARAADSAALEAAREAWRMGRAEEAVGFARNLIGRQHDCAEAHLLLAAIYKAQRDFDEAHDSLTLAACFKPGWWLVQFERGLLEIEQGRTNDALASFLHAIELGADDARVHNAAGAAYLQVGRIDAAVDQFRKALAIDPALVAAHSNLGYVLICHLERIEEGKRHIEEALRLSPGDVRALCNWSVVLQREGRFDEALALCNELLQSDPGLEQARLNRAVLHLARGEWQAGWKDYEARKKTPGDYAIRPLRWPQWRGEDLRGRTIYVAPEQGLGDEIVFASCLPELIERSGSCIVQCHPKLEKLFRRSFARAQVIASGAESDAQMQQEPDCAVSMGSLPGLMRTRPEDFPAHDGYLVADPARVGYWRSRLRAAPGRLSVGLSWRGGLASTGRSARSIPLEQWLPILSVAHVRFVSLQYTDCSAELSAIEERHGIRIHHWNEAIADYDDTAALAAALDLVICVPTAVVDLAGALGKPTWVLVSAVPEWRYGLEGSRMPWYPSVDIVRQSEPRRWAPIVADVAMRLQQRVTSDSARDEAYASNSRSPGQGT